MSKSLFSLAHTAEDSVSIASWLLRVTTPSASASPSPSEPSLGPTTPALTASDLLYHTISALLHHISLLRSRPPPTPYLDLFSTHRASISLAFNPAKHPLVLLLETYTRQYAEDKRRLDPIAAAPPPDVLAHLERLRTRHLEAVRDIHGAMREVAGNGEGVGEERVEFWSQRSARGLMEGYGHGRDFEGVKGVWDDAMREGGTGVGQQGVTVFFQQCGYWSVSVPLSLSPPRLLRLNPFRVLKSPYPAVLRTAVPSPSLSQPGPTSIPSPSDWAKTTTPPITNPSPVSEPGPNSSPPSERNTPTTSQTRRARLR